MSRTLVDSNVLLDVLTEDPIWFDWSSTTLERCANEGTLFINPLIYAEVSIRFTTIEELEAVLPDEWFKRLPLPLEAAFLAGKAFLRYRRQGGERTSTLPDFFIGAHAAVAGLRLLTRDARRFHTYFPTVPLIIPE
jgi:predicted nucleic acid-binding protein